MLTDWITGSLRTLAVLLLISRSSICAAQTPDKYRIADGDFPLNITEVEGRWLVSSNSGWRRQYLQIYDERTRAVSGRLDLVSVWYGLAYQKETHTLFASSGAASVYAVLLNEGKFGKVREIKLDGYGCRVAAGIELQSATSGWVACNQSQTIVRFNPLTGKVWDNLPLDGFPYAIKNLPRGRIAVSLWGRGAVAVLQADGKGPVSTIPVGRHPNEMLVLAQADLLLVACSDSDDISWVSLKDLKELRRSHIAVDGAGLLGAQPNALAVDPEGGRIFVALAGLNALAVLTVNPLRNLERNPSVIPLGGGYPTALAYSTEARTLFVADARNRETGPNWTSESTLSSFPAIGTLIGGVIEAYTSRDLSQLSRRSLRRQVYNAERSFTPAEASLIEHFSATRNKPGPIQYVFYILKENRTYDQLFGDIREGDGRAELALFGADVTPNQHQLALNFVLYDNFFVNGDVSADGHFWSMAAASTDYVSKFWPSNYSGLAEGVFDAPYDGDRDHDQPIAVPGSGFIWDRARKLGISYRDYGEWGVPDATDPQKNVIYLAGLKGHYDPYYRDEIGDVTDQQRSDEWIKEFREFESNGKLPRLTIMHLPNDHTVGTRAGYPTPRAMVADNDFALGRVVDTISHSRYWPQSVILVLEDDAQDGPDHIDCHRSPLLVISPFVRRRALEHRRFTTASVLKTIEQVLGMGSMTYFDDRAPSLLADFQIQPDWTPYRAQQPRVPLQEMNTAASPGAKISAEWDFSRPDRAPAQALNQVIWQSVFGENSSSPAPVYRINISHVVNLQ